MQNFIDINNENMGGNESFYFSPVGNIKTLPDPVNSIISSSIDFYSSYDFYIGKANYKSLDFSESQKETDGGPVYNISIKGFYPGLNATMLNLFTEMAKYSHIVKITDFNENIRIAGTKQAPLKFKFSQVTGSEPGSKNGYNFEFYTQSKNPVPYYQIT